MGIEQLFNLFNVNVSPKPNHLTKAVDEKREEIEKYLNNDEASQLIARKMLMEMAKHYVQPN